ncbi:imidazolonepropionase [Arthrobacter sp. Soil782]|uniref:imidazolonepropionase n=1 Tax=Arthrobacter sp. Soil782 TaxID=1736410 RepID=UPI0006FFC47C|nr:imidazolonepropionase [Arthrobacter sp. Soil782]KRF05002.1 imidazolonepropionase [Arthrobacter sp. Soil782]
MTGATTIITGIGELMTQDAEQRVLKDAAIVLEDERIAWLGPAANAPAADSRYDAGGRACLPGWVDSHTHLVFAGDRTAEFEARMAGQSYAAGGISVTVDATRRASDEELGSSVAQRVAEAGANGTTYLETKTGYGLNVEEEARSARIAAATADEVTFLGAHLVPKGWKADDYVQTVTGPMLSAVRPYVQWADVFCETGAFTPDQSREVLRACRDAGLGLRVHGNQLGPGEGVRLAVEEAAASVDHVNHLALSDIDALAGSWSGWEGDPNSRGTVATCLPACDLSTRQPLAPARQLLDAGVPIALASNCNPGTSYTSSMAFCVATAVLQMRLTVAEAVRAATYGGALALHREQTTDDGGRLAVGSLAVGHRADLQLLDAPSATHLAYRPGMQLTHAVWRAGQRLR